MRINYNASAVISNKALNNSDSALSRSLQRLSSGLKINEAQDNPAGLAIAHRLDAQVQGLRVGKANSNDGISVIETADGALAEISSLMQRMSELTVQAATGTYTDDDREAADSDTLDERTLWCHRTRYIIRRHEDSTQHQTTGEDYRQGIGISWISQMKQTSEHKHRTQD